MQFSIPTHFRNRKIPGTIYKRPSQASHNPYTIYIYEEMDYAYRPSSKKKQIFFFEILRPIGTIPEHEPTNIILTNRLNIKRFNNHLREDGVAWILSASATAAESTTFISSRRMRCCCDQFFLIFFHILRSCHQSYESSLRVPLLRPGDRKRT